MTSPPDRRTRRLRALWVLLALLCGLRWVALDRRPLHHDEAVNAWLTSELLRDGTYRYDPANYHGPTLFYLHAPVSWLADRLGPKEPVPVEAPRGESWVRSSAAFWGSLLLLAIGLAPGVGYVERCCGVLLAGSSCTLLYFSRYLIHEPLLLLLTLGMLLALRDARREGWVVPAILAGLAAATKETFGLTLLAMSVAWGLAHLGARRRPDADQAEDQAPPPAPSIDHLPWTRRPAAAILAGLLAWCLAISSCGTHPQGLVDGVGALQPWLDAAVETAHEKPASYYWRELLVPYDAAVLVGWLGATGLAGWRRDRRGLFLALWALLLLAAYSAIPYKTPWLVLQPLLPMILAGAWGAAQLIAWFRRRWGAGRRSAAVTLALLGAMVALSRPVQTNAVVYQEGDLERHPQAYVHTDREIFELLAALRSVSPDAPEDRWLEVLSPDYWPLPWYLRHFPAARFWGHQRAIDPPATFAVLAAPGQRGELEAVLDGWSRRSFHLRPGAELDLYLPADSTERDR